jgi:comEA protein
MDYISSMLTVVMALALVAAPANSDFQTLRVLYTSDLSARSRPTADFSSAGLPRRTLGGWPDLAVAIDTLATDATLLLDCGGFAFGSPEADSGQGRASLRLMNHLRYDASVLGARDFAGGLSNIELLARAAAFPVLADPMLDVVLHRQAPLFRPCISKEIRGIRLAVIGVTDPDIPVLNRRDDVAGIVLDDPVAQVRRYLPAVQPDKPGLVIVIGHVSRRAGQAIADSFPQVGLVICGAEPAEPGNQLPSNGATPVVCAAARGQRVGVADVLFNKTEQRVYQTEIKMVNVEPTRRDLGPQLAWTGALAPAWWDSTACENRVEFPADSAGRLALASVVADAMRAQAAADIAVLPLDAVTAGLANGPLTHYALFGAVPYRDRVRLLVIDDTTLAKLVAPESVPQSGPAPMLANADYFAFGDSQSWPQVAQVGRVRVRDRKPGVYRVVTTEQWLERSRVPVEGRLLEQDLTDMWLAEVEKRETLSPVALPRCYPATPGTARQVQAGLVNINTADSQLLQTLPGVGPMTAQRIIEYRTNVARFGSVEDILNVKGIGPKKYEKLKPLIAVR